MLGDVFHTLNTSPVDITICLALQTGDSRYSITMLTRPVLYYPKTWSLVAQAGGDIQLTFVMPCITYVSATVCIKLPAPKGCLSFHLQMSITIFPPDIYQ